MRIKHGKNFKIFSKGTCFIDKSVIIGDNVTIYENNRIEGNTVLGNGVVVMPNCYIKDTVIGENSVVEHTHSDSAKIGKDCKIGPYARLRPNADIRNGAKIGNFVEIKNATVGEGSKVSHLAYVGDADLGKDCNVGCGVIFVNYNGKTKSRTVVGDNCFIGSNVNVIAPVNIESKSYICAGTTVTKDVKTGDFVIGRARQETKPNRAQNYLKEW